MSAKEAFAAVLILASVVVYAQAYGSSQYGRELYGTRSGTVSLGMIFSIAGTAGDSAEADGLGAGYYNSSSISNYYGCVQDSMAGTPAIGIVFNGRTFDYINLSGTPAGSSIKMSETMGGNKFLIAVTESGCAAVRSKFPEIRALGYLPEAFVPFAQQESELEATVSFPDIDLIGNFAGDGPVRLVLERTEGGISVVEAPA
jgi:hypothetical protein